MSVFTLLSFYLWFSFSQMHSRTLPPSTSQPWSKSLIRIIISLCPSIKYQAWAMRLSKGYVDFCGFKNWEGGYESQFCIKLKFSEQNDGSCYYFWVGSSFLLTLLCYSDSCLDCVFWKCMYFIQRKQNFVFYSTFWFNNIGDKIANTENCIDIIRSLYVSFLLSFFIFSF